VATTAAAVIAPGVKEAVDSAEGITEEVVEKATIEIAEVKVQSEEVTEKASVKEKPEAEAKAEEE